MGISCKHDFHKVKFVESPLDKSVKTEKHEISHQIFIIIITRSEKIQ
jgi:hypothetical protein